MLTQLTIHTLGSSVFLHYFCSMKRWKRLLIAIAAIGTTTPAAIGCTSAIIGVRASATGRPLLWKLRDTSATDNKVEYVAPHNGSYGYVALFNATDRELSEAWMGMNEAGFAIMNTASYNLKDDNVAQSKMDKEGVVMTRALMSCRTVDDFRRLLDSYPRPMGVEANFGVIDAEGNGAYFETNNHSYTVYPLDKADDNVLIRTNYSHSGRPDEGYGFIREKTAEELIRPAAARGEVTPEFLTENVSRSFRHSLYGKDFAESGERWVIDQDFIPRYKSTATIVIEGMPTDGTSATAGDIASEYIMWTGMGYPPCSEIIPVWCRADGVDSQLRGIGPEGRSPMCDRVKARRAEVFPIHKGSGDRYLDITTLFNAEGMGYVQTLRKQNHEVYRKFGRGRKSE